MKIIPAKTYEPKARGLTPAQRAQQAAIERSLSRYIKLECGHYTTPDDQLFLSGPPHPPKTLYCEYCDKWVFQMPKPIYAQPDEPPF